MVALRGRREMVECQIPSYSSGGCEGGGGRVGSFKYLVTVVVALRGGEGDGVVSNTQSQ